MHNVEIANDLSIATELVPGSSRYFGTDASAMVPANRVRQVLVSGVVQTATETQDGAQLDQLQFQLRVEIEGSNDRWTWHRLGAPTDSVIASYFDTNFKRRSRTPNTFRSDTVAVAGHAWVRARWTLYPVDPNVPPDPPQPPPPLISGLSVRVTAHLGLMEERPR